MGVPMAWWVAGFHNRTGPSLSALASSLPLGLNATASTPPFGPPASAVMGALTGRWVARLHSCTVPSPSALASSLLLGLNATQDTPSEVTMPARRGAPTVR